MPPFLASALWLVMLVALLHFDPAKRFKISPALWVPVIWLFIIGSRLPSQWLGMGITDGPAAQSMQEGNAVDSTTYSILILLSIAILASRSFQWANFFSRK